MPGAFKSGTDDEMSSGARVLGSHAPSEVGAVPWRVERAGGTVGGGGRGGDGLGDGDGGGGGCGEVGGGGGGDGLGASIGCPSSGGMPARGSLGM